MTPAHRTQAVLTEDGKPSPDHLPSRAGRAVEVIVLPVVRPAPAGHPPTGSVLHYDRPADPAAAADRDAAR